MVGDSQNPSWPMPMPTFSVAIGEMVAVFAEVSGLDVERNVIDYRAGNSKLPSGIKMPELPTGQSVILKKGVFPKESGFWNWFSEAKMNTVKRETVTITLMDVSGKPTMTWTLANAFPTKFGSTDLKADGAEIAIESIEFAHEGLTIETSRS